MQHIPTEVQAISTALFSQLQSYQPSADLGTWGYSKTVFPGGCHEVIEGTFAVSAIPSVPAGYDVFLNFTMSITNHVDLDESILSGFSRAYVHTANFSHSEELGEVSAYAGEMVRKRSLESAVVWRIRDAVLILDGWFDKPDDMSDEDYAAQMARYQ